MHQVRHLPVALVALMISPVFAHAASNPTHLTWTASPLRVSVNSNNALMSSAGYLSGDLALAFGSSFACGAELVARPGRSESMADAFDAGNYHFDVLGDYQFAHEFRYASGDNQQCQGWIDFAHTVVRPWTVQQYASCWSSNYTVYDIILGAGQPLVTTESRACASNGNTGDAGEGLDDSGAIPPHFVYLDLSHESLPTSGIGSADFMIALRNRVSERASLTQTEGVVWRETDGVLRFVSGADLAAMPASASNCGDAGDDPDPVRRKPPASEATAGTHTPRVSWGQVRQLWR